MLLLISSLLQELVPRGCFSFDKACILIWRGQTCSLKLLNRLMPGNHLKWLLSEEEGKEILHDALQNDSDGIFDSQGRKYRRACRGFWIRESRDVNVVHCLGFKIHCFMVQGSQLSVHGWAHILGSSPQIFDSWSCAVFLFHFVVSSFRFRTLAWDMIASEEKNTHWTLKMW